MTTPHGAIPELDDQAFDVTSAWLQHSKTSATGTQLAAMCNFAKFILESRAAIQQAAGAVPEGWRLVPVEPTPEMMDSYRRVKGSFQSARSDWAAMLAASPAIEPPKQQSDHLAGGECGGVTLPLTDERLLVSFLRNTTVFHQSDTPEWLYARDGDGNSASIRTSEIVSAIRGILKELP